MNITGYVCTLPPNFCRKRNRLFCWSLLEPDGAAMRNSFSWSGIFTPWRSVEIMEKIYRILQIRTRVLSLLTKIFAIYREASGTSRGKEGQVQEIIRYINQNLSAPLSLEGLAQTFYMSKNHLTAVFKRATGTTVARYILYKRMAIVRKELSMGVPAAEAASRAGFGDYSSFFRAYKKMFGCAPSDKSAPGMPEMDKGSMV